MKLFTKIFLGVAIPAILAVNYISDRVHDLYNPSGVDTAFVRCVIDKFDYGMYNIPTDTRIKFNKTDSTALISHFYLYNDTITSGDCFDLSSRAYSIITKRKPDYHLVMAGGRDPDYFTSPDTSHFFLLASSDEIPAEGGPDELEKIIEADPVLIDPALGVVGRLSETGYSVDALFGGTTSRKGWQAKMLSSDRSIFLGENRPGEICFLGYDQIPDPIFFLKLVSPGSTSEYYYFHDPAIVDVLVNPRLRRTVANIMRSSQIR